MYIAIFLPHLEFSLPNKSITAKVRAAPAPRKEQKSGIRV